MEIAITPLADRVLIEKTEKGEETRSGIILPKSQEGGETNIGTVIAVGEGKENDNGTLIKPKVAIGQKVIFSWGEKVEVAGKEYYIVSESGLLGILQ